MHRDRHHKFFDTVDVIDVAAALIEGLFRQNLADDLLRDGDAAAHQRFVGGQQDIALRRADQEVHIGHPGGHFRQLSQGGILIEALVAGGNKVVGGHLGDQLGPGAHLPPLLRRCGAVAEGKEADAQQQQRQHHQTGSQGKLMPVQAVEFPLDTLDHDGCFTSNL